MPLAVVFAAIGVACSGSGDEIVPSRPFMVKGCLTASGDRFVLTDLDPGVRGPRVAARQGERPAAEAEPTTENYRLLGKDAELRRLVGERVEVTGLVDPARVVELRETTPLVRSKGPLRTRTSGKQPTVRTTAGARFEISELRVRSVRPTGEHCVATSS
jgi:hypothetical protein